MAAEDEHRDRWQKNKGSSNHRQQGAQRCNNCPENRRCDSENPESKTCESALQSCHGKRPVYNRVQRVLNAGKESSRLVFPDWQYHGSTPQHSSAVAKEEEQDKESNERIRDKSGDASDGASSHVEKKGDPLLSLVDDGISQVWDRNWQITA